MHSGTESEHRKHRGKRNIYKDVPCPSCGRPLNMGFLRTGIHNPIRCGFKVDTETKERLQDLFIELHYNLSVTMEQCIKKIYQETIRGDIHFTENRENTGIITEITE